MINPRKKNLALLGLGLTVGTKRKGIIAEVWVVKTLDEVRQNITKAEGKIIVFNQQDEISANSIEYHTAANAECSKNLALATLFRTNTNVSLNNPHAAVQVYETDAKKIPSAFITTEDCDLLQRIQDRGETIVIHLTMNALNLLPTTSRNVIGDIKGHENPKEVVIVSGHIDSWDVGQGALDDGGGILITVEALAVLKFLKLRPRRTLRAILWTTEEIGQYGAKAYVKQHKKELEKISIALESDFGTFAPVGFDFFGSDEAGCIVKEVLKLLAPVNATAFTKLDSPIGTDIDILTSEGVPTVSLKTNDEKYYWYHHSQGDTMEVQNTHDLDLCTAVWTVAGYVLADLSVSLPREKSKRHDIKL